MVSGPSGARQRTVGACDPHRSTCCFALVASVASVRFRSSASLRASSKSHGVRSLFCLPPSAFRLPVASSNRWNRSRLQSLHAYASSRLDRICPTVAAFFIPAQFSFYDSPFPVFFTLLFPYCASYFLEEE